MMSKAKDGKVPTPPTKKRNSSGGGEPPGKKARTK
jgi:hypothetical protein